MTQPLTRGSSPGRGLASVLACLCVLTGTGLSTPMQQPAESDPPPSIADISRAARARRGERVGRGTWVSTSDGLVLRLEPQPADRGPTPEEELFAADPVADAPFPEEDLPEEDETPALPVGPEPSPAFSVSAGVDQTILLPDASRLPIEVRLKGLVIGSAILEARWSLVSAPRAVGFSSDRTLETIVRLDAAGEYVFRLSVSSGTQVLSSDVYVNVVLSRREAIADPPVSPSPSIPPAAPTAPSPVELPAESEEAAWNPRVPPSETDWVSPGLSLASDGEPETVPLEQTFAAARPIVEAGSEVPDVRELAEPERTDSDTDADDRHVYYVSPEGDDGSPGTDERPFRTLQQALGRLEPGDTLYLRAGSYSEGVRSSSGTVPSGTSFEEAVTIRGYPGEQAVLRPLTGPGILYFDSPVRYTIWRDLVLDGGGLAASGAVGIGLVNFADHNRFRNIEVRNTPGTGVIVSEAGGNSHNEFLGLDVHDVALGAEGTGHGIQIGGSGNLIEGGDWHRIEGSAGLSWAILIDGAGSGAEGNVVRNTRVYGNAHGIAFGGGDLNLVYNNLLYDNNGSPVQIGFGAPAADNAFLNNTVVGNAGPPIQVLGVIGTRVFNNILWLNGIDVIADAGTETLIGSNLDQDPLFSDPEGRDFRLTPGSPALDAGMSFPEVVSDFDGTVRPQGSGVDIGAFERSAPPVASDD